MARLIQCGLETSTMRRPMRTGAVKPLKKQNIDCDLMINMNVLKVITKQVDISAYLK